MNASRDKKGLRESQKAVNQSIKAALGGLEAAFAKLAELDVKISDRTLPASVRNAARDERERFIAGSILERYERTAAAEAEANSIRRSRKTSQDHHAEAIQHEENAKRFYAAGDDLRAKKSKAAAAKSRDKAIELIKVGK